MSQLPIISFLAALFILLPLGAGIYLWNISTRPMRLLTGLLLYGSLSNLSLLLLYLQSINNMFLFHLYTVVSYLLITLIFSCWHKSRVARYMRFSTVLFFICYVTFLELGYEDLQLPNKYSQTIAGVLVAIISLYTLSVAFKGPINYPAFKDERFWVSVGVFINYSGGTFIYIAIPTNITYDVWTIWLILDIFSSLLYFKGYLCLRR